MPALSTVHDQPLVASPTRSKSSWVSTTDLIPALKKNGVYKCNPAIPNFVEFMRLCTRQLYMHRIEEPDFDISSLGTAGPKIIMAPHSTWTLEILSVCLYYLAQLKTPDEAENLHFIVDDFALAIPFLGQKFKAIGATNARAPQIKEWLKKDHTIMVFPGGAREWVSGKHRAQWDHPSSSGTFRAAVEVAVLHKKCIKIFLAATAANQLYKHLPISNLSKAIWNYFKLPFFICLGYGPFPLNREVRTTFLPPIEIKSENIPDDVKKIINAYAGESNIDGGLDQKTGALRDNDRYMEYASKEITKFQKKMNTAIVQLKKNLPKETVQQKLLFAAQFPVYLGLLLGFAQLNRHARFLVAGIVLSPIVIFMIVFATNYRNISCAQSKKNMQSN